MAKNLKSIVRIKKLKGGVNYRISYDYMPIVTAFIKESIPREHWKVHVENTVINGKPKDIWSRDVRAFSVGGLISFFLDNSIPFQFVDMTEGEINELKDEFKKRQKRLKEILREKVDGLKVDDMDFSYMKIQPYGYQKQAVKFFEMNNGISILGDEMGVGKAQNLDSLIATPEGWVKMGDVKIGQKIFSRDGKVYPIIGIYPQGIQDSYRVIMNDGFFMECNLDHIFMVKSSSSKGKKKGWVTKTLRELSDGGFQYNNTTGKEKSLMSKWQIPLNEPCEYPEKDFLIHPYVLGALIGDGYICGKTTTISIPDNQIQIKNIIDSLLPSNLQTKINRHPNCPQYNITQRLVGTTNKNPFKEEIERLRLNVKSINKFIPKEYLYSSVNQRLELLRGLMDTDGSCLKNRSHYHTKSKELAKNVCELVQSLGGQSILKSYDRTKEEKGIEYRVNVKIDICPFNLDAKKKEWKVYVRNRPARFIKKIEYVGKKEQQCISIDSPDNTYITDHYIVTHNTLSAISYATKHNLKTLIVCPASLKLNWKREIEKFTGEKAFIYKYKPSKTSKYTNNTKEESLFHIINYESLETYMRFEYTHKCSAPKCTFNVTSLDKSHAKCPQCKTPKSVKSRMSNLVYFEDSEGEVLNTSDYKLLALDECHYIKNEKAQRTKIIKKGLKEIEKKILISGTPIKNRPYEFFPILNFLKPEEFNNSHEFAKKHCAAFEDKFGWNYEGASNLEELFERISPFFLRRLKSDVTELPPKTYINIPIELTDKQARDYKRLEEGIVEKLAGEDNSGDKKNHLTIMMELRRFVSEIKTKESIPIIENMIEQGEKVVVFSEFKYAVEIIKKHFGDKAVMIHGDVKMEDRNNAVEEFQKNTDDVMVFAGTIGAAGVGLTLTRSSNLINLGLSYSPSENSQVEDRIHRAGATASKITIMTLLCENTIDDYIQELLHNKSTVIDKAIDNKVTKKEVETINMGGDFHGGMGSGSIFGELIRRLIEKNN